MASLGLTDVERVVVKHSRRRKREMETPQCMAHDRAKAESIPSEVRPAVQV
jgi:hypothetical protein